MVPGHPDLRALLATLHTPGADWVGLRGVVETTTAHHARDGKPERSNRATSLGVMVEVLVGGCFGYAATSQMDAAGLQAAADTALLHARAASPWQLHPFNSAARPASVGAWRPHPVQADRAPAPVHQRLAEICARLHTSDAILRTTAIIRCVDVRQRMVSTSGADVLQEARLISTDWAATAARGPVVQRRSDGGSFARSHQADWDVLDDPAVWARVDAVAHDVHALLDAEECPTETTTLVLAPDQMMLQIHESIGHPLEVDRILGDERNYAGTSFIQMSDFGTLRYGSDKMTVTWDPTVAGEMASYAFDDVGQAARREVLIHQGLLLRGLGGLESQLRGKVQGVATQRASLWNRPAIDRMANLNLEPGAGSFDDIIAGVRRGVFMRSNRSWSIDDRRDKFQFGCEWGRLIEDGQLTRVVRNPNYRGRTRDFWHTLTAVGGPETVEVYGTPYCGKGEPNQAIRVGHASPVCRFDGVDVFGGAS